MKLTERDNKIIWHPFTQEKTANPPITIKEGKGSYIFDENETHYFILLMPKTNTDVNYIKTLLSDYHINKFSIETFEISATLFGKNKHLIMIKDFHGSKKAKKYFNSFNTAIKVNNELLKTESKKLLISAQNFQYFFKNSDLKGYYDFFRNNYLNELTN